MAKPVFEDRLAQEAEVFLPPRQRSVAANLGIALARGDAIAVLTGASGTGKTTLGAHAVRSATTRLALAWLGTAPLSADELLEQLLNEFGYGAEASSRAERVNVWRQFLNEMGLTETRVCVLVDKAETWDEDVLAAAESLTAADPGGCPGASLVLTGAPGLRERLAAPSLDTLRQRTRFSYRLDPLSQQECEDYLSFKLADAGVSLDAVFAPGAVERLYAYAQGVFRVVKNVSESALTVAAAREEARVTSELVDRVCIGLYGLEPLEAESESAFAACDEMEPDPDAGRETAPVPQDFDDDVPTLTDSIEFPGDDALLRDALAEAEVEARAGAGGETETEAEAGAGPDPGIDADAEDPQLESLQALANADALEDISNSLAEALFGEAELEQLGATLAVASAYTAARSNGGRKAG